MVMTHKTLPLSAAFTEAFQRLESVSTKVSERIKIRRQVAMDKALELGLPTLRNEEWRYTNLRPLLERPFTLALTEADCGSVDLTELGPALQSSGPLMVFIDGVFTPRLSRLDKLPQGLTLKDLPRALSEEGERFETLLKLRQHETSGQPKPIAPLGAEAGSFALLSDAFLHSGAFIHVARGTKVPGAINLVHLASKRARPALTMPRTFIVCEPSSELEVIETFLGFKDDAPVHINLTDAFIGDNARLTHCKIQRESTSTIHVGGVRAGLGRDSQFSSFNFAGGAQLARTDLNVALIGEASTAKVDGLYTVRGTQHVDNHTVIDHRSPHTTSSQLYKGILLDKGRAVFNGKVFVQRDAQKSSAFQTNKNLLMSSGAEVDTKPQLEIDADDVKCSHGATVGQLDENELFYLQSRGIPKAKAQSILCHAFAGDVVASIESTEAREKIKMYLADFLPEI